MTDAAITFAKVSAGITAAAWAGFGVWLMLAPDALPEAFEATSSDPFRTEVRAFYGGLELGIAAVIALLANRHLPAAVLVGAFTLGGIAIGRGIGLLVDGFFAPHAIFMTLELIGAIMNGVAYRRLSSRRDDDIAP